MSNNINFKLLLPGNLAKVLKKNGEFYHLTWKENQKTVTRYVRLDEVKKVREGVKEYNKAKKTIERTAKKNLKKIFKGRKK